MTEAEFSAIALKVCLAVLIIWMFVIIYKMGRESRAGKFGMMILLIALGAGIIGFIAKGVMKVLLR